MTTERQPTRRDIQALVDFLRRLYGDGTPPPVIRWITKTKDGTLTLPWPEYDETVERFIELIVSQGCWMDTEYVPEQAKRLLMDEAAVRRAAIPEIRQMLTLVVRGERFCDGWWASLIDDGHVRRLLERLVEIEQEGIAGDPESRPGPR